MQLAFDWEKPMDASCQHVLTKLKAKRGGVTVQDFGKGFRLAARIFDLRQRGYHIETIKGEDIGRYVLMREQSTRESE